MATNHHTRTTTLQRLEDANVREQLIAMEQDPLLHKTKTTFSANAQLYPDGQMPFVEKHMAYLVSHPSLDPIHYLANLRLMMKQR